MLRGKTAFLRLTEMHREYRYVGPYEIAARVAGAPRGTKIRGDRNDVTPVFSRPADFNALVDEWIETGDQVAAAIRLVEGRKAVVAGIATINMDENEKAKRISSRYRVHSVWESA